MGNKNSKKEEAPKLLPDNIKVYSDGTVVVPIAVIGDGATGKSSIVQRFLFDRYVNEFDPTIEEFYVSRFAFGGKSFKFQITDTGRVDDFQSLVEWILPISGAFIVVYSCTNKISFHETLLWVEKIRRAFETENLIIALVANQCDLLYDDWEVSSAEGAVFASNNNLMFFETSAKENINVKEIFHGIAERI